jgi:hypothetical protein
LAKSSDQSSILRQATDNHNIKAFCPSKFGQARYENRERERERSETKVQAHGLLISIQSYQEPNLYVHSNPKSLFTASSHVNFGCPLPLLVFSIPLGINFESRDHKEKPPVRILTISALPFGLET